MYKVSCFYQKVHIFGYMLLYYICSQPPSSSSLIPFHNSLLSSPSPLTSLYLQIYQKVSVVVSHIYHTFHTVTTYSSPFVLLFFHMLYVGT